MTRFVERADEAGLMHRYEIDDDGNVTVESIQDTTEHIDANKQAFNAFDASDKRRDLWRVASIPDIIIVKWLTEYGVNVLRKDHADRVRRLLNDPDWKYLRTAPGTI